VTVNEPWQAGSPVGYLTKGDSAVPITLETIRSETEAEPEAAPEEAPAEEAAPEEAGEEAGEEEAEAE